MYGMKAVSILFVMAVWGGASSKPIGPDQPARGRTDGDLTVDDVEQIFKTEFNRPRNKQEILRYALEQEEFKDKVNRIIKDYAAEEWKCEEGFYYDPEIPDCKNCSRPDCDIDPTCRAKCRETLKIRKLEEQLIRTRDGLEILKRSLEDQDQRLDTDESWHHGFIAAIVLVIIAVVALLVFVWKKSNEPRLVKPEQPQGDLVEGKHLMVQVIDTDSGHGSISGLQTV